MHRTASASPYEAEYGFSRAVRVGSRVFVAGTAAVVVGAVHGELFRDIRPAATMVVVAKLLRPEWRIEIEAEALVGDETA